MDQENIKKKMNRGLKIGLGAYTLLLLVDLVLFFWAGPIGQYIEINPLYKLGGGLILPILLNLLLIGFVWWQYRRTGNPSNRYALLLVIVTVCFVRLTVIISNINVLLHPPTLAEAQAYYEATKDVVVAPEIWAMLAQNILPYLSGALAFLLFNYDHKMEVKK